MGLARSGPSERQEHDPASAWWGVHVARYRFAAPYSVNHRTLDIACGTGYGLAILQKRSRWVVGVELDAETARKAHAELGKGSGAVLVADGCCLPFANGSFEIITSFETLEHLEHREKFLAELRRVLTPEGLCILSTPNANYTLPVNGRPRNPYHVHEYTPSELKAEMRGYFAGVELLGQVLDSRFTISPFWDDQQKLPRSPGVQARLLLWRILNKLPSLLRERLSEALWGHPYLPHETDYQFSASAVETAPVLVALCRCTSAG